MRVVAAITCALLLTGLAGPQSTSWPVDAGGTGGFSVTRLPGPVTVDGRRWVEADVKVGEPQAWRPAKADYMLHFTAEDEQGDIARWGLLFERSGGRPVSLTAGGTTGFVFVTPDARYIFIEPLIVIDVRRWRRYALYSALGISPYVNIEAISRDERRLLISRRDCAFDCPGQAVQYFELTLPS